jgi:hypothetical protein
MFGFAFRLWFVVVDTRALDLVGHSQFSWRVFCFLYLIGKWRPFIEDTRWLSQIPITLFCSTLDSFFFLWRCGPTRAMASSLLRFLDHTQRHTTVGRTPLDKWSARRRDLYLTAHNTYNRQTSMPPVGFEPTIPAGERPQTHWIVSSYFFHMTFRWI